jgi:hypothetical protein
LKVDLQHSNWHESRRNAESERQQTFLVLVDGLKVKDGLEEEEKKKKEEREIFLISRNQSNLAEPAYDDSWTRH